MYVMVAESAAAATSCMLLISSVEFVDFAAKIC